MQIPGEHLTIREKAAIFMYVYGDISDWQTLYIAANKNSLKDAESDKNLTIYASRWKNNEKVKGFLQFIQKEKILQEEEQKRRYFEEFKIEQERQEDTEQPDAKSKKEKKTIIDYSDPENRKRLYNEVIRDAADDPKTRLDAAKVFEQIQRDDKQAAKDNQIQRFYTPLSCYSCPLYEKAKKKSAETL